MHTDRQTIACARKREHWESIANKDMNIEHIDHVTRSFELLLTSILCAPVLLVFDLVKHSIFTLDVLQRILNLKDVHFDLPFSFHSSYRFSFNQPLFFKSISSHLSNIHRFFWIIKRAFLCTYYLILCWNMDPWIIAGITLTFRYDYMIYIEKIRIPFFSTEH